MTGTSASQEITLYTTPKGEVQVEVRVDAETVWLSQRQMADLFGTTSDNVGLHLKNTFGEKELSEKATTEEFSVVRTEGRRQVRRHVRHYNLDAIISVGYRVNSKRGVHFRIWATKTLRDHLIKGYSLIPGPRTKNAQRHTVPLTPAALEILEGLAPRAKKAKSEFVFPARGKPEQSYTGYSKGKRELDASFNKRRREEAIAEGESPDEIEDLDWTLHDLRRTAATRMAELGILPHVVERVLNHVSGTFGRVAGIYNRFQYVDEMRDALTTWESHVLGLLGAKDGQAA